MSKTYEAAKKCGGCGETMLVHRYQIETQMYHDKKCMSLGKGCKDVPCLNCQRPIRFQPSQGQKFCDWDCRREFINDYIDPNTGYKTLYKHHGHPIANDRGMVLEHRKVLFDAIGPGPHPCAFCGTALNWGGSEGICVDHIDEDKLNNSIENLRPACIGCNWNRSRWPGQGNHGK